MELREKAENLLAATRLPFLPFRHRETRSSPDLALFL